ncbi:MAG: DNA translocase FtsK [Bacteroidales bacterium]|nr:DNA translocase FtsK [Bacteroidales bacterium]
MAAKGKGKVKGKGIRQRLTQEQKDNIRRYAGLLVLVLAAFTLLSVVSYLFTWKEDMSQMSHIGTAQLSNWCGRIGYMWANLLVARTFGLGSFFLVFLLGAVAYNYVMKKSEFGLLRVAFITLTGAFLSSLLLAYVSDVAGVDTWFDGGMGGDAGASVVMWLNSWVGVPVTGLFIMLLVIGWMILSSSRFSHWFSVVGEKKTEYTTETVQDTELDADPDTDMDTEMEEELEVEPEPEPELEPEPIVPDTDPVDPVGPVQETGGEVVSGDIVNDKSADGDLEIILGDDIVTDITEELPPFDNRLDLEKFESPSLDLLHDYADKQYRVSELELNNNTNRIRATLLNYKIEVQKVAAVVGPTVTLYKVVPAPGVRVASIETLHREIAMSLGVDGVRVVTLPDSVGIEVPNSTPSVVPLKSMLNSDAFRNSTAELPVALGYTITQEVKTFDLADAPHLLVAGATKQGKSVGLNVIISSLLYSKHPSELKFVFVDPKKVEFTAYNRLLKHYLAVLPSNSEEEEQKNAIVKSSKSAEQVLSSLCIEMDKRYSLLESAGVNDFKLYNEKYKNRHLLPTDGHMFLPYLVVVIDEYSDLIMAGGPNQEAKKASKNIEASIIRLAQMGRAAGIHVIIATQRPSVNVITGLIKANFPTRIAFRVLSSTDSRTILDSNGAENLIGKGDMLYYAGVRMERVQCALITMNEINKITKSIGEQTGYKKSYNTPYYLPVPETAEGEGGAGMIDMQNIDPLFEDAAKLVVMSQKGSTSDVQRRLGMGYARAGRVMDQLEAAGIVGPQEGSKTRQVLVADLTELEEILSHYLN